MLHLTKVLQKYGKIFKRQKLKTLFSSYILFYTQKREKKEIKFFI